MRIGELSKRCDIAPRTIRFYERRHLLGEPTREPNGYRTYDQTAVDRIRFIRRAQSAGLTLAEIGRVIDIRSNGEVPCTHVTALLNDKLRDANERLAELRQLKAELVSLINRGATLDPAKCGADDVCQILQEAADGRD